MEPSIHEYKCKICDEVITDENQLNMAAKAIYHINKSHGLKLRKYKQITKDNTLNLIYRSDILGIKSLILKIKHRDIDHVKIRNAKLFTKLGDVYHDLLECKICGLRSEFLSKHIINIHSITNSEYINTYNSPVESVKLLNDKSERSKGELNGMYGKGECKNSPFSVEFYVNKGYTEEESVKLRDEFSQRVADDKPDELYNTKVAYYITKYGVDEITAIDMFKDRQTTNSIESIAIRKNISLEEAQLERDKITDKWLTTLNNKTDEEKKEINIKKNGGRKPVSDISYSFFNDLIQYIGINSDDVKYGSNELKIPYEKTRGYYYDFNYKNKIIEFNGDMYHANPLKYFPNERPFTHISFCKDLLYNKPAYEFWKRDLIKADHAINNGYEIFVIWHSEVKRNKLKALNKCKAFLLK